MKKTLIVAKKVKLKNPILIEGLPGIGLVGKLAVEHMIRELKAVKFAEIYSPHFPHQVLMLKNGTMRMLKNKLYYWKNPKKNGNDLILLIGDVQAVTPEAQYELCGDILDFFKKLGGRMVYTLGGYGVGRVVRSPKVFGSATHKELVERLGGYGIRFGEANGSIIGAAGLLLGIGKLKGMKGVCLMGETHGSYVDANSAKAVLTILSKILNVKLDMKGLAERAKESEKLAKRIEKEAEKQKELQEGALGRKELTYIR